MIHQTFRYRLYPTKAQARVLADTLDTCRDLYNSLLYWRAYDYDCLGRSPTRFEQQAALPGWRKTHPELKRIHSQALQDVVHRVDRAFQDFFRRIKAGETAGQERGRVIEITRCRRTCPGDRIGPVQGTEEGEKTGPGGRAASSCSLVPWTNPTGASDFNHSA